MDYNREVRRATHQTMTSLVAAAGFVPISFHFSLFLFPYVGFNSFS